MRDGYYSDVYFNRTSAILERDGHHPIVRMVVLVAATPCCAARRSARHPRTRQPDRSKPTIRALYDGDAIVPYETVMTIEGPYDVPARLETPYLGALSRRTRIATERAPHRRCGQGKTVFSSRRASTTIWSRPATGTPPTSGALGVSTDANAEWWARTACAPCRTADRGVRRRHRARDPEVRGVHGTRRQRHLAGRLRQRPRRHESRVCARARRSTVGRAPGYVGHAGRFVAVAADGHVRRPASCRNWCGTYAERSTPMGSRT